MKKKAIIISSAVIVAIVCVFIVLLVIRTNYSHNTIKDGKLPILSDEGVRDDIYMDMEDNHPEEAADQKHDEPAEVLYDTDDHQDPSQDGPYEQQDDDHTVEDDQESTDEKPLDNNETPFIMG